MNVIVEGVENDQQLERLVELGCDCFQGFYFSKPVPVEEFEEMYIRKKRYDPMIRIIG